MNYLQKQMKQKVFLQLSSFFSFMVTSAMTLLIQMNWAQKLYYLAMCLRVE